MFGEEYKCDSHYLKFKSSPCQHGFTKSKSTITNLVTYLAFILPLACSRRQDVAIYLNLNSAFDFIPSVLLLS
jgi:hypothetical protein